MATKKSPPTLKKKTTTKKSKARVDWKPITIAGIDVRLWKAHRYDDDGDEIVPFGVPEVDPNYVFREKLVRELAWAVWPHDNEKPYHAKNWTPCLLAGPKGVWEDHPRPSDRSAVQHPSVADQPERWNHCSTPEGENRC